VDWASSYAASLSLDLTNNGAIVYTYALNATQPIYDIPVVMEGSQPTFQCSRPKGKDAQAISKGTKTAEQVCVENGAGFFFTNGINNDYKGCASGCTCCKSECVALWRFVVLRACVAGAQEYSYTQMLCLVKLSRTAAVMIAEETEYALTACDALCMCTLPAV
jgi:hypothetical protein